MATLGGDISERPPPTCPSMVLEATPWHRGFPSRGRAGRAEKGYTLFPLGPRRQPRSWSCGSTQGASSPGEASSLSPFSLSLRPHCPELVEAGADGLVDPIVDDEARPILLAVSDNGPQMTSGSTREFMALCAIAQHFSRPGTPDRPSVDRELQWSPQVREPPPGGHPRSGGPSRRARRDPRTGMGCGSTPGSATSLPSTSTRDEAPPSERPARPGRA